MAQQQDKKAKKPAKQFLRELDDNDIHYEQARQSPHAYEQEEEPPAAQQGNDIESSFAEMQNKNEMAEVLKELFDEKKIYMIGDMSKDEIKLATRIYMIARIKNIKVWMDGLSFYAKFLISKDRKSRSEILRAIAGYQKPEGFLNKLGSAFSRDRGY